MQLINVTGISDISRFVIGLTGVIGFGALPFFLSATLETLPVLFLVISSLSAVLSYIALLWGIFPKTPDSSLVLSYLILFFVWGPIMMFITNETVSYILKLEMWSHFSLGLIFIIWGFISSCMILGSLLLFPRLHNF